jgi:hypothetical protein
MEKHYRFKNVATLAVDNCQRRYCKHSLRTSKEIVNNNETLNANLVKVKSKKVKLSL